MGTMYGRECRPGSIVYQQVDLNNRDVQNSRVLNVSQ